MPLFRPTRLTPLALCALAIACGGDDGADAGPAIDASTTGTFSLSWSVTNGANAITCADVGAELVRVTAIEVNSAFGTVVSFNCDEATATSRRLEAGTYRLDIDLRIADGRSLLAAPLRVEDVVITIDGDTAVDAQTFSVIPQGALAFRVGSVGVVSSCTDLASGGAGILSLQFHLRNSGGACVPTTFTVAAGGQPGGTYTSDCTAGTTFNCIENDQSVTVATAPSGARTLEVIGIIEGDVACRRNQTLFSLPGNNLDIMLGEVALDVDTLVPGCENL